MKPLAHFSFFESLEIRVGRVVEVEAAHTKKPAYRITVDFGPEIGTKVSCGAYTNYSREQLIGTLVIGVVNFAPKKMGPETSEVLILGVLNEKGETIYLAPESNVLAGSKIF